MVGKLAVEWTWNASGICYHLTCLCNGLQSMSELAPPCIKVCTVRALLSQVSVVTAITLLL